MTAWPVLRPLLPRAHDGANRVKQLFNYAVEQIGCLTARHKYMQTSHTGGQSLPSRRCRQLDSRHALPQSPVPQFAASCPIKLSTIYNPSSGIRPQTLPPLPPFSANSASASAAVGCAPIAPGLVQVKAPQAVANSTQRRSCSWGRGAGGWGGWVLMQVDMHSASVGEAAIETAAVQSNPRAHLAEAPLPARSTGTPRQVAAHPATAADACLPSAKAHSAAAADACLPSATTLSTGTTGAPCRGLPPESRDLR